MDPQAHVGVKASVERMERARSRSNVSPAETCVHMFMSLEVIMQIHADGYLAGYQPQIQEP